MNLLWLILFFNLTKNNLVEDNQYLCKSNGLPDLIFHDSIEISILWCCVLCICISLRFLAVFLIIGLLFF